MKIFFALLFFSTMALAQNGEILFENYCSTCHNFKNDGIGPQLGGLAEVMTKPGIRRFIENPQEVIDSGNQRAQEQFAKFKLYMPPFDHLSSAELDAITDYIYQQKSANATAVSTKKALDNPITENVALSELVLNIKPVIQVPLSGDKKLGTRITKMATHPVSQELLILDLRGKLYSIKDQKTAVFFDIATQKPDFINVPGLATGFGSFAFHPDYKNNGLFYTTHTERPYAAKAEFALPDTIKTKLQWVLCEWKTADVNAEVFVGKPRELFRIDMPGSIHGVQEIAFNPNAQAGDSDYGLLYVGVGDGATAEMKYLHLVHQTSHLYGTVIRIDPLGNNSKNGQYGIPKSNPFAKNKNAAGEIFAMGFRNPHRILWTADNKMLVTNIGFRHIESINCVKKGDDFGWPYREGTFLTVPTEDLNKLYPLPKNDKKYKFSYPIMQLDHDEINAISTLVEYRGQKIPELKGKVIFCSIVKGRLFYFDTAEIKKGKQVLVKEWRVALDGKTIEQMADLTQNPRVDLRFGTDRAGEVYLFTKPDGKVYGLER